MEVPTPTFLERVEVPSTFSLTVINRWAALSPIFLKRVEVAFQYR